MATMDKPVSDRQLAAVFFVLFAILPVFFIPVLFNTYRLPREALSALVAAALSLYWLLQLREHPGNAPRYFPMLLPMGLFFGTAGITLFNSVSVYAGMMHSLALAGGLAIFYAVVNFVDRDRVPLFLRYIALAGVCISLIGILQTWGVRFSWIYEFAAPASLYGNKNLAAQFLLFSIPAALFLLLTAPGRKSEIGAAAVVAVNFSYMSYTWARSSWGALAIAMVVLAILLLVKRFNPLSQTRNIRCKALWLLAAIVLVALMNILPARWVPEWRAGWTVGSTSGGEHLASALNLSAGSARSRFAIWQNTLAMFRDHFLVGFGPGNFQYAYPLYSHSSAKDLLFNVNIKAAEAHNDYLQLLAERGVLGTVLFLWILLALATRLWQGFKPPGEPLLLPLAVSLCAMLLLAFWDFPLAMPVPTAFFWAYAGMAWNLSADSSKRELQQTSQRLASGVVAALALCSALTAVQACRHAWADYYYARSLQATSASTADTTRSASQVADSEQAIRNYPYDYRYHFQKARLLTQLGRHADAASANLAALSWNPYDINTLNNLGVNYTHLGNIPAAIAAYELAVDIWPDFLDANNSLAMLYEVSGQKDKAISTFRKSLKIQPGDPPAAERLQALLQSR
jgi:O-antigen ligase